MKRLIKGGSMTAVGLIVGITGLNLHGALSGSSHALAAGGIPISSRAGLLPQRPDVAVTPLTSSDLAGVVPTLSTPAAVTASATAALRTAESEFGITDAQIDPTIGIVSATVDPKLHPMYRGTRAWVVTADVTTPGQGPAVAGVVYQKLCIVISVTTGKYVFAYAADPQ